MTEETLKRDLFECLIRAPDTGLHIDPVKLLQYMEKRAILLAVRTAAPKLDAMATEGLRGRREETLTLITQLKEVIENAPGY